MLQMYLLVYTNGIDPYIAHRAFLLIDKYQTNCTAAANLDSEHFRSAPRTCRPFCGRLSVRQTDRMLDAVNRIGGTQSGSAVGAARSRSVPWEVP